MNSPQEIVRFKAYCLDYFNMNVDDKAFDLNSNNSFTDENTRRLFLTWWFMDRAKNKPTHRLWRQDFTSEKLNQFEKENELNGFHTLKGFWSNKDPYSTWFLQCTCCNQLIKSIDTALEADCPEEFKIYQEQSHE